MRRSDGWIGIPHRSDGQGAHKRFHNVIVIAHAQSDLRVTIQALGWRADRRYLPLHDDIASTAFWYQQETSSPRPPSPDADMLEAI